MDAVPNFYRGAAKINRVIFRILPDQNVILTQLRSGEIQYASLAPRDLAVVRRMAGLRVVEVPTLRSYDIAPNYQRVYWQDVRVRRAVLMAINRSVIVQKVLLGHGSVINANTTPASWAYNPHTPGHPYDPAQARTLLDEAGWRPRSDGIREKNGQRLSFGVMINNFDPTLEQVLTIARQDLRAVGVEMRIERVEPGIFGSRRKDKTFDALSRVWNPVYDPDQTVLVHSDNFYGYSDPRADKLTMTAAGTFDRERRKRAYAELQVVLSEDVARLWLYSDNELHAIPANLQGVQPHPVNLFWNIKDWQFGN
jgi:peptide/nickel transport system substrate-binding protein